MKHSHIKAARMTWATGALVLLAGCGQGQSDSGQASGSPMSAREARLYYGDVALPSTQPDGLAFVRVERFADPAIDGQRVQLVFGNGLGGDTVYLCTRPADGGSTGGTDCPYPGKHVLRVVDSGSSLETVYALDVQDSQTASKGGSDSARRAIGDLLSKAATEESPSWFVTMTNKEAE